MISLLIESKKFFVQIYFYKVVVELKGYLCYKTIFCHKVAVDV